MVRRNDWERRPFNDPIPLRNGRNLATLNDAAKYITKLPKAELEREAWQTAIRVLIATAKGRDLIMHARIAVVRALNRSNGRR